MALIGTTGTSRESFLLPSMFNVSGYDMKDVRRFLSFLISLLSAKPFQKCLATTYVTEADLADASPTAVFHYVDDMFVTPTVGDLPIQFETMLFSKVQLQILGEDQSTVLSF